MKLNILGTNQTEITFNSGLSVLFSYETPVAAVGNSTGVCLVTDKKHSPTTTKHIHNWLGMKSFTSKETRPQEFFDDLIKSK